LLRRGPSLKTSEPEMSAAPHILVVDDNDALRENIAEALEMEGYAVVVEASGSAALARLAEEPLPRVVLADLMMPGMDGGELLARIRGDPRLAGVRVVITTGAYGSRLPGADGVLTKPFGVKDLLATLRRVGL
jgi:CheY-like chemotaxis protein